MNLVKSSLNLTLVPLHACNNSNSDASILSFFKSFDIC